MFQGRNIYSGCFLIVILGVINSMNAADVSASTLTSEKARVCDRALPMDLDRAMRGDHVAVGTSLVFWLNLPAAGLLSVEVTTDRVAAVRPKLGLLGSDCRRSSIDRAATTIERSNSRQVIVFHEAGDYYLEVAATDPRFALGAFQLATDFLRTDVVRTVHHVQPAPGRDEAVIERTVFYSLHGHENEPEEVDPDPNTSQRYEPVFTLLEARVANLEKNEPEEVDPDPNTSARRRATSVNLLLFPARRANGAHKNEPEEVDPDPNTSTLLSSRVVDGLLVVDGATGDGSEPQRSLVSFHLIDSVAPLDPLFGWLAEVLATELARSRLITPGFGDRRLRLLEIDVEFAG